jgi:hypothetical protein
MLSGTPTPGLMLSLLADTARVTNQVTDIFKLQLRQ